MKITWRTRSSVFSLAPLTPRPPRAWVLNDPAGTALTYCASVITTTSSLSSTRSSMDISPESRAIWHTRGVANSSLTASSSSLITCRSSAVVGEDRLELAGSASRTSPARSRGRSATAGSAGAAACRGCRSPGARRTRTASAIRPALAAAASSLARIRAMIASITSSALMRPSRMCSRSRALRRRNSVRRVIDVDLVADVAVQRLDEVQRARHAVDEGDHVDRRSSSAAGSACTAC